MSRVLVPMRRPVRETRLADPVKVAHLVASAYRAALGESDWGAFLDSFVQETGGDTGYLYCIDVRAGHDGISFVDVDERATRSAEALLRHNHDHPIYTPEFVSWCVEGAVFTVSKFIDQGPYRTTDAHAEVCADFGLDDHLRITLVRDEPGVAIAMSTYREGRRGDYADEHDHLAWAVAPHVARAARIALHRGALPSRAIAPPPLDDHPIAFLTLDARGELRDANAAGRRALHRGDVLFTDGRRLRARRGGSDLDRGIAAVLALAGGVRPAAPARLHPVPGVEILLSPDTAGGVLVMLLDRRPPEATDEQPLAALTPQQHAVAERLSLGMTISEAARDLGISTETVKTHVKHVYDKLGIASRAELANRMR